MSVTTGMILTGLITLIAGLLLVRKPFASAPTPASKILTLGPVFSAVALAMFAAEHFLDAADLAPIVPKYLPSPLFWTYFAGLCLLAAATSFIALRYVQLSASLLALFFLIIVAIVDLPQLPKEFHDRFFWILTVRETCFASGALVLAGSRWPKPSTANILTTIGRTIVAATFLFYAIQHFLHPHNVPGVPLENIIPAWFPTPVLLSDFIGLTLLITGIGLLFPGYRTLAAATAGIVLTLLTIFFYIPILLTEIHTPNALEGINYVGDTLLFAATALLAGLTPSFQRHNEL